MKKVRKLIAIAMTMAIIFSMAIGLTASASPPPTGNIEIKAPDGGSITLNSKTFFAYKIFDLEISTAAGGVIDGYLYTLSDEFEDFLDEFPAYGPDESDFIDFIAGPATAAQLNQLAVDLMAFIVAEGITATDSETATSPSTVTIADVPYGYYLVTGDSNEARPMHALVTVPGKDAAGAADDAVVIVKADAPSIDKEVWFHDKADADDPTDPDDDGWNDWTDVNIGDTVYFKHESSVPDMNGYDIYWFIVRDSMSKGLTLDDASFTITVDDVLLDGTVATERDDVSDILLDEPYDYIVVINGAEYTGHTGYTDATNFAIYFNPELFVNYRVSARIVIMYEAELNEEAIIAYEGGGDFGNPNKVYLEYSNNPYDTGNGDYNDEPGDTEDTPEDEVWVYTFKFDIYKYTGALGGETEKALAGAEFELRTDANVETTAIEVVLAEEGSVSSPAIYRVATSDDAVEDITTTLVSPGSGEIEIIGLDAGTYYLVETKAPSGYNGIEDAVEVIIVHNRAEKDYEVEWTLNATPGAGTVNIQNNTGTIFPGTGGIGRTIFIVIGITIMAGAVVALTVRNRIAKAVR